MGLREEKKAATRLAISDTATSLFTERGFDAVTVAEVAAAARVSVNTVFNYFPTKEDLFFDRQDAVVNRLATAAKAGGIAGIRNTFLAELQQNDPTLAMAGTEFWTMIDASPALQARLRHIGKLAEEALAKALESTNDPMPRITAAVLAGVDRALHDEIRHQVLAGEPTEKIRKTTTALAKQAYDRLEQLWT